MTREGNVFTDVCISVQTENKEGDCIVIPLGPRTVDPPGSWAIDLTPGPMNWWPVPANYEQLTHVPLDCWPVPPAKASLEWS